MNAMSEKEDQLIIRDYLAIERTRLANERTFLSYFRTFVVMLSSGIAIQSVEMFSDLKTLGWILIGVAPIILAIGVARLFYVKKQIKNYYKMAR
jgi:putative membrane protein